MAGSAEDEAIVLRSIRYGEADRVLHLYTPGRGRSRARSRRAYGARQRASAAAWSRSSGSPSAPRGPQRPPHGHRAETQAGHPRLRENGPRARAPPPARATRWRGCSTRRPAPRVYHAALQRARAAQRDPSGQAARTRSPSGSSCCSPPALARSSPPARPAARTSTCRASRAPPAAWSARRARRRGSRCTRTRTRSSSRRSGGRSPRRRRPTRGRCARPSGRSARRRSTTPTCGYAAREHARVGSAGPWVTGSTTSPEGGSRDMRDLLGGKGAGGRGGGPPDPRAGPGPRAGFTDHHRRLRRLHGRAARSAARRPGRGGRPRRSAGSRTRGGARRLGDSG